MVLHRVGHCRTSNNSALVGRSQICTHNIAYMCTKSYFLHHSGCPWYSLHRGCEAVKTGNDAWKRICWKEATRIARQGHGRRSSRRQIEYEFHQQQQQQQQRGNQCLMSAWENNKAITAAADNFWCIRSIYFCIPTKSISAPLHIILFTPYEL